MKNKGLFCSVLSVLLVAAVFVLPLLNPGYTPAEEKEDVGKSSYAITDKKEESSSSGDTVVPKSDEIVTFIVLLNGNSLLDNVLSPDSKYKNARQLLESGEIREYRDTLKKDQAVVKASIRRMIPQADFDGCFTYNTVVSGFSVTAPYSCLSKLKKIGGISDVFLASSQNLSVEDIEDENEQEYEYEYEEEPEQTDEYEYFNTAVTENDGYDDAADDEETDDTETTDNEESDDAEKPAPDTEPEEITARANETIFDALGFSEQDRQEYTGAGQLIAVIDDSFFVNHEAFSQPAENTAVSAAQLSELMSDIPFNAKKNGSPDGNEKIAFAYDYAGRDADTFFPGSSHGTMTAAYAAGNNGKTDSGAFRGVASGAQLALMKVCPDGSRKVPDDVLLAALDDAAKLSPDILNISLGVPRINTNSDIFDAVYDKLFRAGICIVASAGNDEINTGADSENVSSAYTDYSTISYPSGLPCVISAGASVPGSSVRRYFTANGKNKIPIEKIILSEGITEQSDSAEYEYVYIKNVSSAEEIPDLTGKLLVTDIEEDNTDMYSVAQFAGASAVVMIPSDKIEFDTAGDAPALSTALLYESCSDYFEEHPTGTITYDRSRELFENENAGKPAKFTSWGVTSDLRLKPDISAPGVEILSASDNGYDYDNISGTSASSAGVSGIAALLSERLSRWMPEIKGVEKNQLIRSMMQNTASPANAGKKLYSSPRQQGAGAARVSEALASEAVLRCGELPCASMGDNEEGVFTFELTLQSLSEEAKSYKLKSALQTDRLTEENGLWYNTFTPEDIHKKAELRFVSGGEDVSVIKAEPGESVRAEVHITLDKSFVSERMKQSPNGFYVDGYIFLEPEDGTAALSLPFTGYCGKWSAVSVFDSTVYDGTAPVLGGGMLCASAFDGYDYPCYPLGQNMTTGLFSENRICIGRDTMKNYLDDSTVGTSFIIPNTYLLRDAAEYSMKINDSTGKELYSGNFGSVSAYARGDHAPYLSLLSGINSDKLKNLFAELKQGKYICTVSASAVSSDGSAAEPQSMTLGFEVDNTSPSGLAANTYVKDGRTYLELHAADLSGVQGFLLYTAAKTGKEYGYADRLDELVDQGYIDADCAVLVEQKRDETTATYVYDITNLYHQLSRLGGYSDDDAPAHPAVRKIVYRAVDYAYNLSEPKTADTLVEGTVSYKFTDQNKKPVSGAVISLDGSKAESGKDGTAVFDNVLPGLHEARLISLPEDCETDFTVDAPYIRQDKTEYKKTISVKFSGEYTEESSEKAEEIPEEEPEDTKKGSKPQSGQSDKDPLVPLLFVGILLLILVSSFLAGRLARKKHL